MKNIFTQIFLTFFFLCLPVFTLNSFAISENEKLKKGEIIVEDFVNEEAKNGSVKMTFLVEANVEKIWTLLVEYDKWPSFMPDLEKVVIRENKPEFAIVYVKAKAPLNIDISYVLKRIYNKKHYEITWTMVEGKAKEIEGSWRIFPLGKNLCKVIYTNYLDLGFIVPPKIVALLTKQKLPNVALGMRKYLKKMAN